jgi:DNA primase small subunit
MSASTREFVQKTFLEYYTSCFSEISVVHGFEEREFAALLMNDKIMVRHKRFKEPIELQSFLCSLIPGDVYYSSAHYKQPDAPDMNAKGWIGADLIFDIDADHIPTSCDKIHDNWTCNKCGFKGKGELPQKCPICQAEKFEDNTWPCEKCLTSAKIETIKLLDVLFKDFGFSNKEVQLFFSGHRGYHVHVEDEAVESLDAMSRKEIVDYVCGFGFETSLHGLDEKNAVTSGPRDVGWRGRVARGMCNIVLNAGLEDYQEIGLKKSTAEIVLRNRDAILKNLNESRPWRMLKGVGPETFKKLVDSAMKSQFARVDTVVTTDIHRLIRMPGTLHGKTGLKKVEFPCSSIDDFDPFKSAIAFKGGNVRVFVSDAPEFRLGDGEFGPFRNEKAELPTAAALMLICKKRAEVCDTDV